MVGMSSYVNAFMWPFAFILPDTIQFHLNKNKVNTCELKSPVIDPDLQRFTNAPHII